MSIWHSSTCGPTIVAWPSSITVPQASKQARRIRLHGFEPRAPSRRVWFARNRAVAERRARRKSHGGERPLVLRCGIDIGALARNAESGHIFHSRGVLSVRGPVPASVLREETGDPRRHAVEFPHEPVGLARWINRLLELQPHKSAGRGIGVPTW